MIRASASGGTHRVTDIGVEDGALHNLSQQALRTTAAGMPLEWIDYQEAVRLYHMDQVAYTCGSLLYSLHGGFNAITGLQSVVHVSSIIATHGNHSGLAKARRDYLPPLSNPALFRRDVHLCMYCGQQFHPRDLSRDHITPVSRGGTDSWTNVVTACKRCNHHKAGRTPEEAGMALLAVPFTPTHAEYIYLQGKRILADQLEFLLAHFPRTSPLQRRLAKLS